MRRLPFPKWRKYWSVFATSLSNQWAYSADLMFRSLFFLLILLIYMELWRTALGATGTLAGLGSKDMVWYLVYTESILLAFPRFDEVIAEEVKSGQIAYRLLRPMSYLGWHMSVYLAEISFRFVMNLIVGGALVYGVLGPAPFDVLHTPALLVVTATAFLLSFQISAALALLAFWVEETTPFFWIYQKLMFSLGGLLVPNDLMPAWLKHLADILPFSSILYAPARLFVRYDTAFFGRTLLLQWVWIVLGAALTRSLFFLGVKRLHVHGG